MTSPWRLFLFSLLALRLLGGDLAVLQGMAWAGMLLERAPERGLVTAVKSTFSGDEPCGLCCAIKKAKAEENIPPPAQAPQKKDLPGELLVKLKLKEALPVENLLTMSPLYQETANSALPPLAAVHAITRGDAPPVPPPRALVA